jgi:hypothetical protein
MIRARGGSATNAIGGRLPKDAAEDAANLKCFLKELAEKLGRRK